MRKLDPKAVKMIALLMSDPKMHWERAARQAGYDQPRKTAKMLKKDVHFVAQLDEELRKRTQRYDKRFLDTDILLAAIADHAFFDPRKLFNEKGELVHLRELPFEVANCITSIKVFKDGSKKALKAWQKRIEYDDDWDGFLDEGPPQDLLDEIEPDEYVEIKWTDTFKAKEALIKHVTERDDNRAKQAESHAGSRSEILERARARKLAEEGNHLKEVQREAG